MLIVMAFSMSRQLPVTIARRRWGGGLIGLVALGVLTNFVPLPTSFLLALEWLAIIAFFCTGIILLLLWKNPALDRLLAIRLDAGEEKP
jgi:hypothetical protein